MSKRSKATEECLAKWANDPVWKQHRLDKEKNRLEREKRFAAILAPVLDELKGLGLEAERQDGNELEEIAEKYAPIPVDAVEVLLRYLPEISEQRSADSYQRYADSIVRTLCDASEPFDGRPLKACFKEASSEGLKFSILSTIACTHPHSIDDWIAELLEHHYWGEQLRNLGYEE